VTVVTNEEESEVKQKTIIYTPTFDGKNYTHFYS
jgi:hypothetical protein